MKKYQTEFKLEVVKSFLVIGVNYLGRRDMRSVLARRLLGA